LTRGEGLAAALASSATQAAVPTNAEIQSSLDRQPMRSARRARSPARERSEAPGLARVVVHELQIDHVGRVTLTRAELDDPGIAAGPVREARRDLGEQLVHHVL